MLRDPFHFPAERVPVDQHGAVDEVREGREGHPGALRGGSRRVGAADPGLLVVQVGLVVAPHCLHAEADPLGGDVGAVARVLGGNDGDVCVGGLDLVRLDRIGRYRRSQVEEER